MNFTTKLWDNKFSQKMKNTFWLLIAISFLFASCKDESEDLGFLIQPSKDKITVVIDSFHVATSNLFVDSIYARSSNFTLGKYTDNIYGSFNASFLTQFKYVQGATFPSNATADSLSLVLYYKNFWGDSLSTHEVTVYALDELFNYEKNYYSNINVAEFTNKQTILGKKVYTAVDKTIPDSIRNASDYVGSVTILLPNSLKEEFFTRSDIYTSQQAFLNFFKGIYATTTYGDGTVLLIDSANIELKYSYATTTSADVDTIIKEKLIFPANKEITSVTHINHPTTLSTSITDIDSIVYVHSPAGIFPKISIPFDRIIERVPSSSYNTINHIHLIAEAAILDDNSTYSEPSTLLLIREQDIEKFFAQSLFPATSIGIYAFLGTYNSTSKSYTFTSMADYFRMILKNEGDDANTLNDFVLVPVKTITNRSGTITSLRHLYNPRGIRLRSGKNITSPMRIEITYSQF